MGKIYALKKLQDNGKKANKAFKELENQNLTSA